MAGTNAGFNASAFKAGIRQAMTMGLPNAESERITFRWNPDRTYQRHDAEGNPWEWDDVPLTDSTQPDVLVTAAVEFAARPAGSLDTSMGQFDASRVIVTILDEDYETIRGADLMLFDGNEYDIQFVAPPLGLFEVTIYSVYGEARDES